MSDLPWSEIKDVGGMERKGIEKNKREVECASKDEYLQSLDKHCQRFLLALRQYPTEKGDERKRLATVMDQHLKLILAEVPEIQRTGISKEAVIVERAYQAYIKNSSIENYAALDHAVETLRQYNC